MVNSVLNTIFEIEKKIQELHNEAVAIKKCSDQCTADIANRRAKAEADYQATLSSLASSDSQIQSNYSQELMLNSNLLDKSNASLARIQGEQISAIQHKFDTIIKNDTDNIAWLTAIMSEMPEKLVKKYGTVTNSSAMKTVPNLDKIRTLYEMINTDTAGSFAKKMICKDGYYHQGNMKQDFVILVAQAKKYLENEIVRAKRDCQSEILKVKAGIDFQKQQNRSSASSSEVYSGEKKDKALQANQSARESAQARKKSVLEQIARDEVKNKEQVELMLSKASVKRKIFFSSSLISTFKDKTLKVLVDTGYNVSDWQYNINRKRAAYFSLGKLQVPVRTESKSLLKVLNEALPDWFDGQCFNVPLLIDNEAETKMYIQYDKNNKNSAYGYIQSFIVQKMRSNPANSLNVFFADPNDRGQNLGVLIDTTENNEAIGIQVQNSKDGIRNMLKNIVKLIDDLNGELGTYKSLYEYNRSSSRKIKENIVVLCDVQNCIDQESIADLRVIWEKAARSGINVFLTSQYAYNNLEQCYPNVKTDWNFLNHGDNYVADYLGLQWRIKCQSMHLDYSLMRLSNAEISKQAEKEKIFVKYYRDHYAESLKISNAFVHNRKNLCISELKEEQIKYGKAFDGIELPIMLDASDGTVCHDLQIGTTNSQHALITGGTGSGKSRFLHMIITSIIMNYHPGDVELWLIDCKKNEFDKFLRTRTQHIRLVSLERTQNFAFAFLDYLNDFAVNRTNQMRKLAAQVAKEVPNIQTYRKIMNDPYCMPRVIIIMDEFHIITQHLTEDIKYKTLLENMLSEYRSLGISFVFCDQSVTGLKGLTDKGKQQLHCRIAMKNSLSEIKETLGDAYDSSIAQNVISLGEKDYGYFWWNKNPRTKYQSIFITGTEETNIINEVNAKGEQAQQDSKVILVDGNVRNALDFDAVRTHLLQNKKDEFSSEIMRFCIGTPTTLDEMFSFGILQKYNNNILISGRDTHMTVDMVSSLLKSTEVIDNIRVIIFADAMDDRYRLFQRKLHLINNQNIEVYDDYNDICKTIYELHAKVKKKRLLDRITFVVWFGLTDIYDEFCVNPAKPTGANQKEIEAVAKGGFVVNNVDNVKHDPELIEMAKAMGISLEDALMYISEPSGDSMQKDTKQEIGDYCYNATQDMLELFSLGGKFGLFNVVSLENVADSRKIKGLDLANFIHKIAFCMPRDESIEWGFRNAAAELTDGLTALYTDGVNQSIFKPFIIE